MLPIYNESYRPSSQWTHNLATQRDAFNALKPLPTDRAALIEQYLLVEQIINNLALGDIAITSDQVKQILATATVDKASASPDTISGDLQQTVIGLAQAIKHIDSLLASQADPTTFAITPELLIKLHALMLGDADDAGKYREQAGKSMAAGHEPVAAIALPRLIANALDWFNVDSFRELHPVEQAWLVHLRLIDLQPFARANGRLARLIASFYCQRANFGPLIIKLQQREIYNIAVTQALQMITQPGIELCAQSLYDTLTEMIKLATE